jgi:hypothetical protein
MKRITLLAVLAVVLTVVAIPVMAATTFAWSGEITSTYESDFAKNVGEGVITANVTLGVTINPILSFTGLIITTANTTNGGTGALTNGNGAYYATVDIGAVMGLDPKTIAEKVSVGNFATGATVYAASGYANEEVWGVAFTGGALTVASTTTISNMINVYVAFDPASGATRPHALADVYGVFGPLSVSVGIASKDDAVYTVVLDQSANVLFSQAMGDLSFAVALGEDYNLSKATYNIGFGGKVAYKTLLTVGVGGSYGTAGLGTVDVNVNIAPAANYGADVWTVLDTANSMFGGAGYLDLSGWVKLDASTLRVGYIYTTNTGTTALGYYVARTATGGLYFLYDLTF